MVISPEEIILIIVGVTLLLDVLVNISKIEKNVIQTLLFIVLYPILVLLAATAFLVFVFGCTFTKLITLYLKIKYNSQFLGLVKGMDVLHTITKTEDSNTTTLLIVEYDSEPNGKGILEHIQELVDKQIIRNKQYFPKLFCSLNTFMGYSFMRKAEVSLHNCVKRMEYNENIKKPDLLKILSRYYHVPLPPNGILWDLHVGTRAINWKELGKETTSYYPILLRFHHFVADGINLSKFVFGVLADRNDVSVDMSQSKQSRTTSHTFTDCLLNFGKFLYVASLIPSALFSMLILKGNDRNFLHGKPFIGKETLGVGVDEGGIYFNKIKNIKKKCPSFTISEILITVISESLKNYCQKNSSNILKNVTALLPTIFNYNAGYAMVHGNIHPGDITLLNNYVGTLVALPLTVENENGYNKNAPLTSKLRFVKKEMNAIKNSAQVQVNYIITHYICGVLPKWMIYVIFCVLRSHLTCSLSILPGPTKFTFSQKALVVADCFVSSPHMMNIGICFSAFTYDNRLELGLNVEGTYISDQEEAQEIIDNIYKYIDTLDAETDDSVRSTLI